MDNLCIRSFLQETQSLSLLILIWCVASVPTVSPYPFFSISFLSCNIYLYYELNDFLFCLICFSLVFFWCVYITISLLICQCFFAYFFIYFCFILLFYVVFLCILSIIMIIQNIYRITSYRNHPSSMQKTGHSLRRKNDLPHSISIFYCNWSDSPSE